MIGVLTSVNEKAPVEEFFQLFKTPWQFCRTGEEYSVIITTGEPDFSFSSRLWIIFSNRELRFDSQLGIRTIPKRGGGTVQWEGLEVPFFGDFVLCRREEGGETLHAQEEYALGVKVQLADRTVLRIGYHLFKEIQHLIEKGQPACHAPVPTLDLHIHWLRHWIVAAGVPVVEIPPVPRGFRFFVCLTHDVDFIRIARHRFDRSFWGFLYRGLFSSPLRVLRGQLSLVDMFKNWGHIITLPLVFSGLKKDIWFCFDELMALDAELKATYFLVPFKNRAGKIAPGKPDERRRTRYDVSDLQEVIPILIRKGLEVGLHGIDAWHDEEAAREEQRRIGAFSPTPVVGIRMHWLYSGAQTAEILDRAGFLYNSTIGFNTTVGFRAGTGQVFRHFASRKMLELPLHIQDIPLFSPRFLNLSFKKARSICSGLISHFRKHGGVLTILWHLRSVAPERFWGKFYQELVESLKRQGAFFGTAGQIVQWFRYRRKINFLRLSSRKDRLILTLGEHRHLPNPGLFLRVTTPGGIQEFPLNGKRKLVIPLNQPG